MNLPTLPPLPLVEDHLFVDNSAMEKWQTCGRSWEYSVLRGRVLSNAKASLNYGAAIHAALQVRYTESPDLVTSEIEAKQIDVLTQWFAEKPNPVDDHRTLELATMTIKAYNHRYRCEPFVVMQVDGKPAVELPFAFHLYTSTMLGRPIKVMFCGKIDLKVQEDGVRWVLDHKTSSIFGEQHFKGLSVSPQMIGYVYGWKRITGETPNGFIVNSIKVVRPTKRDGLVYEPNENYLARLKQPVTEAQLTEWEFNTIEQIEGILWHYSRGYMPQKKAWCMGKYGPCDMFSLCELSRQEDRLVMLHSDQYTDNIWSPLNDFHKFAGLVK